MKHLIFLLLLCSPSYATTIRYTANESTYVHNYRPTIDSSVEWNGISDAILTYDTETTRLTVSSKLTDSSSPQPFDYFPFWMSQELSLDYTRIGEFLGTPSDSLSMKDYQGNLIISSVIESWFNHADDFSWVSIYIYACGESQGDSLETGAIFSGTQIHNPEPASFLLFLLALPLFTRLLCTEP